MSDDLLSSLHSGTASRADLYELSNLSHTQAETAYSAFAALLPEARLSLLQQLLDIAENDFEVDFGEFFRQALRDDEAEVRRMAVEGLWEDEDVRLVPMLASRLEVHPARPDDPVGYAADTLNPVAPRT